MVSVWEPFASRLKDSGGAIVQTAIRSYWSGAEGPVHLVGDPGILFGREKYLAKYPDTTRNLLLAIDEATMWIRNNPEQATTIAAKALNSTTPAMLAVVKAGYIYFNFDQELVDELRAETLFLREQGMIPKEFDAESWMAPQYMSGVLADRVTYRPK
jgi:ABC-type nitrate/sulfonate/bicarbonate transport system substrate-binding protein